MLQYDNKYCKNKSSGLILIIILIFLQVLSLLGLYAIKLAMLEIKESRLVIFKNNSQKISRNILSYIENKIYQNSLNCMISITNTEVLLHQSLDWWKSSVSCHGNFLAFEYYYVVEFLGKDRCSKIENFPEKIKANYYRITLLVISKQSQSILQSTVANPNMDLDSSECDSVLHVINAGRQMIREMGYSISK